MPLTINVGLNRKTSKNYNSEGYSINLTTELDQGLLHDPERLQSQIDDLYAEAEEALRRQSAGTHSRGEPEPDDTPSHYSERPANGRAGRNQPISRNSPTDDRSRGSASGGSGSSGGGGGMTQSQRRAVFAIAGKLGLDPADEAHHEFGIDLESMSVREASKLIDHLKGLQQSPSQGARR